MAKLTRKEFAAITGQTQKTIGTYVKRGVLIEENKRIDTELAKNKQFIIERNSKTLDAQIPKVEIKENKEEEEENNGIVPSNVDFVKKQYEIQKLQVEVDIKNLELQKKKEKVLPLDFVIDWSGRNIRGAFGETVNFANSMIEDICNDLDAEIETKLKYKKKFKQGFNEILSDGIKKQLPEALRFAKDYALISKW